MFHVTNDISVYRQSGNLLCTSTIADKNKYLLFLYNGFDDDDNNIALISSIHSPTTIWKFNKDTCTRQRIYSSV